MLFEVGMDNVYFGRVIGDNRSGKRLGVEESRICLRLGKTK
jgi:hypothetical protein